MTTMLKEIPNVKQKLLLARFNKWQVENLVILQGKKETNFLDTFGFPYTSSGIFAGLWNTNTESVLKADNTLYFDGLTMSENGFCYAIFTKRDDDGNESAENHFILIPEIK